MSEPEKHDMSSDEMLVAFLDGQLPPADQQAMAERLEQDEALAQRLAFLGAGRAPFRDAFDALLDQAPTERMAERLQGALAVRDEQQGRRYSRRGLIAAAISLVAVGAAAGSGGQSLFARHFGSRQEGWRGVVANYMALYSTQTLAHLTSDPLMLERQVASVSQSLGLSFQLGDIGMPEAVFKRAQLLEFGGRPLGQFAYLDADQQPLALCVIANTAGAAPPQTENRYGMNVVFWSSGSHSFLVIGHRPLDEMQAIARKFRSDTGTV